MKDVLFLSYQQVIKFHEAALEEFGGGLAGIRDQNGLESAIAMPSMKFGDDFHLTLCEMAATYLYHIIKNHPFLDGNKRTGTITALYFLHINGHVLHATDKELEDLAVSVAEGKTTKAGIASFFETHS